MRMKKALTPFTSLMMMRVVLKYVSSRAEKSANAVRAKEKASLEVPKAGDVLGVLASPTKEKVWKPAKKNPRLMMPIGAKAKEKVKVSRVKEKVKERKANPKARVKISVNRCLTLAVVKEEKPTKPLPLLLVILLLA